MCEGVGSRSDPGVETPSFILLNSSTQFFFWKSCYAISLWWGGGGGYSLVWLAWSSSPLQPTKFFEHSKSPKPIFFLGFLLEKIDKFDIKMTILVHFENSVTKRYAFDSSCHFYGFSNDVKTFSHSFFRLIQFKTIDYFNFFVVNFEKDTAVEDALI